MKKWFSFILVLVLALVLIGCGGGDDPVDPTPGPDPVVEDVKPTGIEITGQKAEIEIGEEFTITVKVLPDNATDKKVRYSTSSSAIATIKDGKVTGISAGTATITVTSNADKSVKAEFTVTVKGGGEVEPEEPVTIVPTAIAIDGKNEVQVGKVIPLTVSYTPEDATKGVTWTSSDDTIAKVNNGAVLGVKEGTATITVVSTVDNNIKATFDITVVKAEEEVIEVINPSAVTVEVNAEEVEVGYKLTARATVEPQGADQNVTWQSTKPEVATIDDNGRITAVSEGTTYIIAYSKADPTIKSSRVKVKVTPAAPPETYPDLQGYTIVLMNADSALGDLNPFLDSYAGLDKNYRQQAWKEVEHDYNCKISVEAYPDEAGWGGSRINWINQQAEVGQAKADFYVISSMWLSYFVNANSAHPVTKYYTSYGKNQMSLSQKQSATRKGEIYALSTGLDETTNYANYGLYYNLGWIERLKVDNPAKLFNEGKWTYSEFTKWVNGVQALLNAGEYTLAGHGYYYWIGLVNAAGVKVADPIKVEVTLNHPREAKATELLQALKVSGAYSDVTIWSEQAGLFYEGKAVMVACPWWFIKASNRFPADLWGDDTRYGYVPFPRPDDMEKDQQMVAEYGTSLLMPASARDSVHPAGVTYEDVYRAMNDTYLRTSKYYTSDPGYNPELLKRTAIESKIDDPESVEAALWWDNSKVFYDAVSDFTTTTTSLAGIKIVGIATVINNATDYQSFVDSRQSDYILEFQQCYSQ